MPKEDALERQREVSGKHVSINIFDLIDSICGDFRKQWKAGERPRIEEYLDQAPENARAQLFRNLLTLDFRYRGRAGEDPTPSEYVRRFPGFKREIGDAFQYSTSISIEAGRETPREDSVELPVTIEVPAANRIGDYELIGELGRGGFGVVYEAKHAVRRNRVALKTLPTGQNGQEVNAERLHKFRREFRSLSEVNHPNLVGMQTLEVDGGQWFFTMDLIEGEDFLSYVRPSGKLDESRLRESLKQLVAGVIALHEQRILHRDLKPSNVLVGADGRVSILDFGLVAQLEQRTDQTVSLQTQNFAGTPRYAAPEQIFGQRSPATDWYALGTMLFEALTGEAPYRGTAAELLIKKREEDAPQLADRDDLPSDLATLTNILLRRDPEQRPTSDVIAEALALETDTISYSSRTPHDDEPASEQSFADDSNLILIGREEQLEQLAQIRQAFVESREPEVVWIMGLSGEGKSSLAEKFLAPHRRSGELLVFSGRCYDRESVPFKVVDVLIEALVGCLRSRSEDQLSTWLPRDIPMLARLFPTLRRVESIEERSQVDLGNIDDREIRFRAFFALRELLVAISRETPIAIFIDDLQWGDADSAEVLADLLAPPKAPAILLLGSYRSDEADQSSFLREWKRRNEDQDGHLQRVVEVTPLTEEQCLEFVAQRVGVDANELRSQARDLVADTKGNPYFLEQLIEGFNAETGQFEPVPLRDIVERKLRRLPDDARDLLNSIAIAGQAITVEEASFVAGHETSLLSTVTHMRSERLARLVGTGEQQLVDTYHDKIRESVLGAMAASQHDDLHIRFGDYIERAEEIRAAEVLEHLGQDPYTGSTELPVTERVVDLAYHFHAAGDSRAFAYQLMAGELSHRAYAAEDALEYLQRAETLLPPDASDAIRYRLLDRLAASHVRLKRSEEGLEIYRRSVALAPSRLARAVTFYNIAMFNGTLGAFSASIANFDLALNELGTPRPGTLKALLCIPLLMARTFLLPRRGWSETTVGADEAKKALQQKIYFMMNFALFESPGISLNYALSKAAALAVSSGNRARFVQGITFFAGMLSTIGLSREGRRQGRRAEAIALDVVDTEARAEYVKMKAIVHTAAGENQLADRGFREAIQLCEETGLHWQAAFAVHLLRHVQQVIGSSSAEIKVGERVLATAHAIGDVRTQCWGQYDIGSGLARAGELGSAKFRIEQARALLESGEQMIMTGSIFLCTEGYFLLQASDYLNARLLLETSWRTCKRYLLFMEYNVRSLPLLIESITGPEWTTSKTTERGRLKQLCRETWFLLSTLPNLHPPIHRARGRAFQMLGKNGKALRSFERAAESAAKLGADYDRARALLDIAAVKEEGREENRAEAIRLLKEMESVIPRAESWLLGEQYDESVVAPEFDLEAWEREHGSLSDPVP